MVIDGVIDVVNEEQAVNLANPVINGPAPDIDLLVILAFAFDPQALGSDVDYVAADAGFADVQAERSLGHLPVLLVRMNNDLVMGDDQEDRCRQPVHRVRPTRHRDPG